MASTRCPLPCNDCDTKTPCQLETNTPPTATAPTVELELGCHGRGKVKEQTPEGAKEQTPLPTGKNGEAHRQRWDAPSNKRTIRNEERQDRSAPAQMRGGLRSALKGCSQASLWAHKAQASHRQKSQSGRTQSPRCRRNSYRRRAIAPGT